MDNVHRHEYMLLDLDKVGFYELYRLLFDEHIGARSFVNSHDDDELYGTFFHRFLIFISIVVRKGLEMFSKNMDRLGRSIESSLNLWSHYDCFCMLVYNTLRGKNVEICQESPNFSSVIGLTDTRIELDHEIPHEDPRYNSALAIMAAKAAYENEARVQNSPRSLEGSLKMEHVGLYNCSIAFETKHMTENKGPTQAFIFSDKTGDHELICVAFRGTSPFSADDWSTDLDLSFFRLQGIGNIHMGFLKALGLQNNGKRYASWLKEIEQDKRNAKTFAYYKIRQVLKEKLKENKNARFIVTGHSLGGALAVLFPAILAFHKEFELLERLEGVYTFGQPRVGDYEFCRFMKDLLGVKRYLRFVYANDFVPRIPFDNSVLLFKHFGYCYYFNSFYKGKVMNEEPNKNYFSIKSMVPMYLNAVFEMVRSLILPYAYGRSYKEGILLMGVRLLGLIFPGGSAHCPQDYVNLTRLASSNTFFELLYEDSDK